MEAKNTSRETALKRAREFFRSWELDDVIEPMVEDLAAKFERLPPEAFMEAVNNSATEASSDRDSPPAAAREDDAGDGSTRAVAKSARSALERRSDGPEGSQIIS